MIDDDKWAGDQHVEGFNDNASQESDAEPRWTHPEPEELVQSGITTEESLDYRAQQEPEVLAPEPTPDDPDGWITARKKAVETQAYEIEQERATFHDRAEDMRQDFNSQALDDDQSR